MVGTNTAMSLASGSSSAAEFLKSTLALRVKMIAYKIIFTWKIYLN